MAENIESSGATLAAPKPFENVSDTAVQGGLQEQLQAELRESRREKKSVDADLNKKIEAVQTIIASLEGGGGSEWRY